MRLHVAAIIALALVAPVSAQSTGPVVKKSPAELAFDRLKSIEGEWDGRSTKGWEDTNTFQVIAGGSVLMCRSFDSHPNETMVTMYHLDGNELVLTHYCVARNQPRLRATSISPDARTIEMTFRDATNLPSRDKGHMDRVVMTFIDDDHFTSQWTWYQDGKEQWMEKIEYVRRKPGQPRPGAATSAAPECHDVGRVSTPRRPPRISTGRGSARVDPEDRVTTPGAGDQYRERQRAGRDAPDQLWTRRPVRYRIRY